jgi:hypothetical protein
MLKIFKNITELTLLLENYIAEGYTSPFTTSDYFYVGYYKPINSLYLELTAQNQVNDLIIQYWNGSSWVNISIVDKTFGLKKSGYVQWERNIDGIKENMVNGHSLFWYRISISTNNIASLALKGINLVFSDDNDLKESYPDIMNYLPEGATSFIAYHQSARNVILTHMRNKGKSVENLGVTKMLDQFDLHHYEEVRQASKYKALASIFYNESDNVDDKWYQKAKDFDKLYGDSINLNFLSLDTNDDGKEEAYEKQTIQYIKIQRL